MPETHHLKVIRYCPKCGSSMFAAVSDRSFSCSKCGFLFYVNSAAAVAALIFNEKGELLFSRRAVQPHIGKLDLPGGFVDPGESAEEALKRELNEELGMEVESLEYFYSAPNEYVFSGLKVLTLDIAYKVKPVSLKNLVARDDISGFEFIKPIEVDFDELPASSMQFFVTKIINGDE
jgi:mutator protein MutT